MTRKSRRPLSMKAAMAGLFVAALCAANHVHADRFRVVHSFCGKTGCADGQEPYAGLISDSAGNLHGTTHAGGRYLGGTVYELSPRSDHRGWRYRVLHSFCRKTGCTDIVPTAPLIVDTAGNLYGTTFGTGGPRSGTIFRLSPNAGRSRWSYTVLHRFCREANCADGSMSDSGLTYAGASSGLPYDGQSPLYGTTMSGGLSFWDGVVYELRPSAKQHWSYRVLYQFCQSQNCPDGQLPYSGVVMDAVGRLFGATAAGGTFNEGTIFQLQRTKGRSWDHTILYSFCAVSGCLDGDAPSDITLDSSGNLLGVGGGGSQTGCGNSHGCGVVFTLPPNGGAWNEVVMHAFCSADNCTDGYDPAAAPRTTPAGREFGTTQYGGGNNSDPDGKGGGALFEQSARFRVRHSFCALPQCADGAYPYGNLLATAGSVFGVTRNGGANGAGVIYEYTP